MQWSEARILASQYQSSGSTGKGFATFASTGNVTTELWKNIHYCETAEGPGTEEWAADMAKLRTLLQAEGYALTAGNEETLKQRAAKRALAALQAYQAAANPADPELGEPGDSTVFSEALQDLLTDLRWLCWDNGIMFPDLEEQSGDRWVEELDAEREAGRED